MNLFKPVEMTSTQAVAILKRLYNADKVGHGGTLDPLADGILPIAFGEATKTVQWAMDSEKEYVFTIQWGVSTASQDAEGEVTSTSDTRPTREAVEAVLANYVGLIEQVPPKFSAIKVDGQRAYDLAREGEDFELKSREVMVHAASVIGMPDADHTVIHVTSGKGFYVRAMARDVAFDLGCDGHISQLRRTRVGPFTVDDDATITLDALVAAGGDASAPALLAPPAEVAARLFPVLHTTDDQTRDLSHGKKLDGLDIADASPVAAVDTQGRLVALLSVEAGRGRILTGFPQEP